MSMRTGNATRDRILADRDAFRDSLKNEPQEVQPQAAPAPQAAPTPAPQVPPQVEQPKQVAPSEIPVPDDFIKTVNNMGGMSAPAPEPQENPELKAIREENAKLQKELDDLRKARENDSASLEELNKLREKQRVDEYLAQMDGLGSINGEDARKLVSPLLQQMDSVRKEGEKQLQETRAAFDKRLSEFDKKSAQNKSNQMYAQILKAHPDLQQLQRSQAYADIMTSPVQAGSAITVGELVAAELKNGNADYVIKVLDTVKQKTAVPNLNDVASISSGTPASAGASGTDTSGDILTDEQIADLRFKVQTGEMSRDEFRARMAKHREASKLHNRK